jgi:uncharacterized protein (UPF0303 family)
MACDAPLRLLLPDPLGQGHGHAVKTLPKKIMRGMAMLRLSRSAKPSSATKGAYAMTTPSLEALLQQEEALILSRFTVDDAWWLGCYLREKGAAGQLPIAIEISVGPTCLFSTLLPGATADNLGWIKRKVALVWRYQRSSYAMAQKFAAKEGSFERYGLDHQTYAAAGGAVPLRVTGVGMVGVVTVSGLPQLEDHLMVLDALAALQQRHSDPAQA